MSEILDLDFRIYENLKPGQLYSMSEEGICGVDYEWVVDPFTYMYTQAHDDSSYERVVKPPKIVAVSKDDILLFLEKKEIDAQHPGVSVFCTFPYYDTPNQDEKKYAFIFLCEEKKVALNFLCLGSLESLGYSK